MGTIQALESIPRRLADAGVQAFLVGETLMRQKDLTSATRALLTGANG